MDNNKAKKAKEELAWEDSRVFARSFESWLKSKGGKIEYGDRQKIIDLFSEFEKHEKEWLGGSYKKAKKRERSLFLKTLIYFTYGLGTEKIGCENLAIILKKMAEDNARLGEFYGYLVQYGDARVEGRGFRFDSLVGIMQKESRIDEEYYKWFDEEFQVPPEGIWAEYPTFFSTKTPKELIQMREGAKWGSLSSILSSIYGIYVGNAVLGKLRDYVEDGGITRITFENKKRAARVATLLFEFGLQDLSQKSDRITLGLKETVYEARKKVANAPSIPTEEYFVESYLGYFKSHGLKEMQANEINKLFSVGQEIEAMDKMCRFALQACKRNYLIMGEKKYSFGNEGREMISDFKKNVGGQGDASLLSLYDMITRGDYSLALEKLRAILDAIDNVKVQYPHMFSS
ncbi:MAG: hypothetical protein GY852_11085 [bacterium]|nr:hypothetical protein [bacterium]